MLNTRAVASGTIILGLALAGCGGGGGGQSAIVPPTGGGSSPVLPAAQKGNVSFTILIPKTKSGSLRPAYVSPATQSMTVSVTGTGGTANPTGFPQTVGLTPSSTGCTSSLASTQCTLQLSLSAGSYAASISTYDGANGTGNALSIAQAVAFKIVANTNNTVPLTLSGVPTQIAPTYQGNGKFLVVALDADGNFIVGAGAPTFTVAKSGGSSVVTITQPTTAAPNAFSIAASGTVGSETLSVTAGYPAGETSGCTTPADCTTSFTASNNQYVFAENYEGNNIEGFSVPFTSSSQSAAFTYGSLYYPYGPGLALDSNQDLFFAASYYTASYPVYEAAAGYGGSPTSLFTTYAAGLATDSNNDLFVSNYETGNVKEYAPPYTGTAINTFTTSYPYGIALDANNDLFVGNIDYSYLTEYPFSNGAYGSAVLIPTGSEPSEVWLDAGGDLWAANSSSVQEFKPPFSASSTPAVTVSFDQNTYCPGFLDSSGDLFLANYSSSGVINEYKAATIAANQGGGTISAPDVSIAGGEYPCAIGLDTAGNLYASTVYGLGTTYGGIAEFNPPFSNGSTPAFVVTAGFDYPYGTNVMTKAGQLSVTL